MMSRLLRTTARSTAAALAVLALSSTGGATLAAAVDGPAAPTPAGPSAQTTPDNWMPGSAALAPALAPANWMPNAAPVNWMPAAADDPAPPTADDPAAPPADDTDGTVQPANWMPAAMITEPAPPSDATTPETLAA